MHQFHFQYHYITLLEETNDYPIDISNLPPSVYLIKIEVEDYIFTKQLTVQ
jgi:hypothetical protein